METWETLLARVRDVADQRFGPHTNEIMAAVISLQDADWYRRVGAPSPLDGDVTRVRSWTEAWEILDKGNRERYLAHGLLRAPADVVVGARERAQWAGAPEDAWWRQAMLLGLDVVDIPDPPRLAGWDDLTETRSSDYVRDIVDRLFEEIIFQDVVASTYFREQFQWLAGGWFPCGWDGDWPSGRMRVF